MRKANVSLLTFGTNLYSIFLALFHPLLPGRNARVAALHDVTHDYDSVSQPFLVWLRKAEVQSAALQREWSTFDTVKSDAGNSKSDTDVNVGSFVGLSHLELVERLRMREHHFYCDVTHRIEVSFSTCARIFYHNFFLFFFSIFDLSNIGYNCKIYSILSGISILAWKNVLEVFTKKGTGFWDVDVFLFFWGIF